MAHALTHFCHPALPRAEMLTDIESRRTSHCSAEQSHLRFHVHDYEEMLALEHCNAQASQRSPPLPLSAWTDDGVGHSTANAMPSGWGFPIGCPPALIARVVVAAAAAPHRHRSACLPQSMGR